MGSVNYMDRCTTIQYIKYSNESKIAAVVVAELSEGRGTE